MPAVLGGEPRQIELFDLEAAVVREHLPGDLNEAKRFRHLARAGMFGPRRAIDQQDVRPQLPVLMALLPVPDGVARSEPVVGQIVGGIGELRTRLARAWRLARMRIGIPGRLRDPVELDLQRIEIPVQKL